MKILSMISRIILCLQHNSILFFIGHAIKCHADSNEETIICRDTWVPLVLMVDCPTLMAGNAKIPFQSSVPIPFKAEALKYVPWK